MIEKIGLYAPVIVPLLVALSAGLGLPGSHGWSLIGRCFVVVGCLCLAVAGFRKIHDDSEPTGGR
jgi:uncharacterized membrane protein